MDHLGATQARMVDLTGASKSVVNQWLSGRIASIDPRYAFRLQATTGISAEWTLLGTGDPNFPAINPDGKYAVRQAPTHAMAVEEKAVTDYHAQPTAVKFAAAIRAMRAVCEGIGVSFDEVVSHQANLPEGEVVIGDGHVQVRKPSSSKDAKKKHA